MDWEGRLEFKVPLNQWCVYHIVNFSGAQSRHKVARNCKGAPRETLWFQLKKQKTGLLMLKENERNPLFFFCNSSG